MSSLQRKAQLDHRCGAITSSGEITLNYVSLILVRGVGKAILKQLEARALELGNGTPDALASTETARRFTYLLATCNLVRLSLA